MKISLVFCFSNTNTNPTTANTKVTSGSGTGSFSCNMTGLAANTTYYVRAYAINSAGTSYGATQTFKTQQQTGPTFNPSIGQYTACSGSNIACGGHTFFAGTIQAGVISSTSSSFTIRVRKCSGSFTNSGTAYVNIGTTCNNAVSSQTYSPNASYVDITVPLRSGTTTYWITVSSATTDYFHANTIVVTN